MGNTVVHVNNEAYQVLRPLAEGGFASVYEVRRDGQLFALKWTRGVAEDDDLERLQLEIQVQRSLQHRNILSLSAAEVRKCPRHGKAAAEKEALMVSPLATRGSLQTHLERTAARGTAAFTEVECLGFFKRLVEAVSALHALGFAHRDLKPGNILLASCDPVEPLVMDFGSVAPLQMNSGITVAVMKHTV
ncbi:hypothetical protein PHYBOEH_003646 [Phytophthora boehmeriae]|uniref:non-specific serine/threonine protein kinase n=1 Tax=Phytophthora boehmeriae TaxID=109152 RepID=A0A8T1WPZ0_9STRA|nr:hypothetical protein PHYBOEH_003646 [Phytophthora boehmeriae]